MVIQPGHSTAVPQQACPLNPRLFAPRFRRRVGTLVAHGKAGVCARISISVTVSGAENATLTEEDFAYDATTGTYIATYEGSSGGIHTATLETADDAVSNDGTSCQSGSTEVDTSALLNPQTA